jgi:ABC-type Fe3+/spermidine/putrescine transport system ATPase subunit
MIELDQITKSYGKKLVLKDLSLEIEDSKLTCLLGSSGCGKTSILRLIAGLEVPESGKISMDKKILSQNMEVIIPPHQRNIGFIFQDLALWPHFTVFKNIAFGLTERNEKNVEKQVFEMLDLFDLKEHSQKYPNQLSGGQKQLVAIARALVLKPKTLLMDEPLASLDVKLKHKILKHIKNLKTKLDITIIYVTHDHKEAFDIADQIIVLDKGKIEEIGTVSEIKNSKNTFVKYFLEY